MWGVMCSRVSGCVVCLDVYCLWALRGFGVSGVLGLLIVC